MVPDAIAAFTLLVHVDVRSEELLHSMGTYSYFAGKPAPGVWYQL